ncbi:hypothetical protein HAX54_010576 [Datura stramonium]|uniref:Uncharacterized protein n=1 Tax=Datura stramonium TaxID=4076 RepID=A0ABS8TJ79_DATST|nr:hypothetical protein [Datura stramonium]
MSILQFGQDQQLSPKLQLVLSSGDERENLRVMKGKEEYFQPLDVIEGGRKMTKWAEEKYFKQGVVDLCGRGVYGLVREGSKVMSSEEMINNIREWDISWVLGGNFNTNKYPEEREGGRVITRAMEEFSEFTDNQLFVDLPLTDYGDRVAGWWNSYVVVGNPSFRLAKKLKLLKRDIRECNRKVFGRAEVKMKELIHEVGELDSEGGSWWKGKDIGKK